MMEYIRIDSGRQTMVCAGSIEYLVGKVFKPILNQGHEKSYKIKTQPKTARELVQALNHCATVLGRYKEMYAITTREIVEKKHWPLVQED